MSWFAALVSEVTHAPQAMVSCREVAESALVVDRTRAWALSTRSSSRSPSISLILCALAVEDAVRERASIALAGSVLPCKVDPRARRVFA